MLYKKELFIDTPTLLFDLMAQDCIKTRFQAIVSTREQSIIGLEALSYGIHPLTGDRITPDVLFAQAKEENVCLDLDRRCREQAMRAFKESFAGAGDYLVWINIETSILKKEVVGLGRLLESVLRSGLSPSQVVLEMVESETADLAGLKQFVNTQKSHGFLIALDDVGTGHSNLERIALIKPDIIKIDRFLIRNIHQEHYKYETVRAVNSLCQGIGALPVAEGIETKEEALAVLDLGITLHQGFYYAHPDQSFPVQLAQSRAKMDTLAPSYRKRRLSFFTRRQTYFRTISNTVEHIAQKLTDQPISSFEPVIRQSLKDNRDLECIYILNSEGIQITNTLCNSSKILRPKSSLFQPASKGTDLSLKEYFLLIKAGLPKFVSDPYISRASGNLCVTLSYAFNGDGGRRFVLCADYDCAKDSILCTATPSEQDNLN